MRYVILDEDGQPLRKFWDKEEAQKFLQDGWTLTIMPKPKKVLPSVETYGEARW